jgi:hypothetical protein
MVQLLHASPFRTREEGGWRPPEAQAARRGATQTGRDAAIVKERGP